VLGTLVELLMGGVYGVLVGAIALLAAIPYGIWKGVRRLAAALGGKTP